MCYLKRCQELANKKTIDPMIKSVHTSPAYIKLLTYAENLKNQETYLLERLKKVDQEKIPEELFDGMAVTLNVNNHNKRNNQPLEVNDVLDAVVRMIKERLNNV